MNAWLAQFRGQQEYFERYGKTVLWHYCTYELRVVSIKFQAYLQTIHNQIYIAFYIQ